MTQRDSRLPEAYYLPSDLPELNVDRKDLHGKIAFFTDERESSHPEVVPFFHFLNPDEKHTHGNYRKGSMLDRIRKVSRRRLVVIGVLLLAICVGLGVGLGLKLRSASPGSEQESSGPKNGGVDPDFNSDNSGKVSPVRVLTSTGLASTVRGDGAGVLLYYQAANGTLIEDFYQTSSVSLNSLKGGPLGNTTRKVVDVPSIADESPLAAISYTLSNTIWRHLFYVDSQGRVCGMNSSSADSTWSSSSILYDVVARAGSSSLSACYSSDNNVGLRLYYGIANNTVLELQNTLSASSSWLSLGSVPNASSAAGIVCSTSHNTTSDHTYLNLFARDASSKAILHISQTLPSSPTWTTINEQSLVQSASMNLGDNSTLALATNANASTSYIFYQGADGDLKRLSSAPMENRNVTEFRSGDVKLVPNSKIAAAWSEANEEGPVVFYQTLQNELRLTVFGREGDILVNGTIV
ncbi:hypothetical protein BDZ85DRAFT_279112 [Elsinoe ampelina]|uniref:Fucose-specific lectin n=1 Tax=Elsinoe ampelina TaxID=302913 RepID=A0A6A6GI53_9PEZI|nr:hypothetical protein BDZ85DRAFT_279112 [Elsinoe ampelina]